MKKRQADILKDETDAIYRFCDKFTETVDQLTFRASTKRIQKRHDKVGQYLYRKKCN